MGDGQYEARQQAGGASSSRRVDRRPCDLVGEMEKIGEANGLYHWRRPRLTIRASAESIMAGIHHAVPRRSTAD